MQRRKVLIADDIAANRLALRLELADRGFEVVEAENGAEALRLLGAGGFDAVVTDIWMPEADGIEVIRALRQVAPDTLVFAITGGGPGMSIASASTLAEVWGAEKVYIKPFDVRELAVEMVAALEARRS